ncbi:LamG domain-containing protein [Limnothrix sp. FACHB-708]|uniref:LamG domain-containing protein n=1 Tax=unclassified Limnothrix TaxID=2632864 RepID=UPI0016845CD6|nr:MULTISPECIES: LamG domain-containing protein [unclassified Limnothrix]MBD2554866.1 LamG domain-containing protein [Limnothrix sp. FACHB-708]MBD2592073.1 LamG domain-containing protein [Limnothrix sp. FACHB-406]
MTSVLHFDGQSNYIRIPHQESLSPANNFTFEAWVNVAQIGGYLRLFSKFPGFGFGLINEALLFTEYWIVDYAASVSIEAGSWYHVAIVFNADNDVFFYLDGELVQTILGDTPASITQGPLEIGRKAEGHGEYFQGDLTEVRFWGTARTQEQIQAYKSYRLLGSEENLLGYWPLNEGSGDVINDKSTAANHGTLQGSPIWKSAALELPEILPNIPLPAEVQEAEAAAAEAAAASETIPSPGSFPIIVELESDEATPDRCFEELLTRGDGAIYDGVTQTLFAMREQGQITQATTPVFVIVRRTPESKSLLPFAL